MLRFTGSELSAAPFACAKEIEGLLCRTAHETLDLYRASGRVGELMLWEAKLAGLESRGLPQRGSPPGDPESGDRYPRA